MCTYAPVYLYIKKMLPCIYFNLHSSVQSFSRFAPLVLHLTMAKPGKILCHDVLFDKSLVRIIQPSPLLSLCFNPKKYLPVHQYNFAIFVFRNLFVFGDVASQKQQKTLKNRGFWDDLFSGTQPENPPSARLHLKMEREAMRPVKKQRNKHHREL